MYFDCATMSKNFLIPLFGNTATCGATLSFFCISEYYTKSAALMLPQIRARCEYGKIYDMKSNAVYIQGKARR